MLKFAAMSARQATKTPLFSRVRAYPAATAALAAVAVLVAVLVPEPRAAMPDFRAFAAGAERKSQFFEYTRTLVEQANDEVRRQRERLVRLADKDALGYFDRRWLRAMADRYRLDMPDATGSELIDALLLRVDAVPASLALAQAAKESGWGTSRFARDGYNLFGEWCFEPGCGIVPQQRGEGRTHEVEAFASPLESVASYLHNLNTHPGYRELRRQRLALRKAGRPLSGIALAEGLSQYSERRGEYVEEVKRLIIANGLEEQQAPGGG